MQQCGHYVGQPRAQQDGCREQDDGYLNWDDGGWESPVDIDTEGGLQVTVAVEWIHDGNVEDVYSVPFVKKDLVCSRASQDLVWDIRPPQGGVVVGVGQLT